METEHAINIGLKKEGFSLGNICESDWYDFIHVEKVSHNKYVAEHSDFFGEWNEQCIYPHSSGSPEQGDRNMVPFELNRDVRRKWYTNISYGN